MAAASTHDLPANFAKPRSGHALPDSHTSLPYSGDGAVRRLVQEEDVPMENEKWNEAEWFVEWLKLARKEGN